MSLRSRAGRGYVSVGLSVGGVTKKLNLHRLVAQTFLPNPLDKPEVNHKDSNKLNNCPDNLEWVTKEEHALYGYYVENKTTPRKLNEEQVGEIRTLLATGMKQKDIGSIYEVGQSNISLINTQRTWNG